MEWLEQLHWGIVFQIVLIDIMLGGDNAVVIALACRKLAPRQRVQGIVWGTVAALLMRFVMVLFALELLQIPYLKIVGALLLVWVGVRLLLPEEADNHAVHEEKSVWRAIRTIIVADFVMSLDNVIGIAGAAQRSVPDHQMMYVIFGLVLSVPIIIWGSALVLKLIDRFPLIVLFGAGLLGWIAGGMLIDDHALAAWRVASLPWAHAGAQIIGAVLVMGLGSWWARRHTRARAKAREKVSKA